MMDKGVSIYYKEHSMLGSLIYMDQQVGKTIIVNLEIALTLVLSYGFTNMFENVVYVTISVSACLMIWKIMKAILGRERLVDKVTLIASAIAYVVIMIALASCLIFKYGSNNGWMISSCILMFGNFIHWDLCLLPAILLILSKFSTKIKYKYFVTK